MFLERLLADACERGIDNILGMISLLNEQSLHFHRKHGFEQCGWFRRVGRKWDNDFDVIWMQKFL
jgi:phosphinothricin acetyltransferase